MKVESSKNFFIREQAIVRKRRRAKKKKKEIRIERSQRKRHKSTKKKQKRIYAGKVVQEVNISVGPNLNILDFPENVIRVVTKINNLSNPSRTVIKSINIDLSKVTDIDIGALTFLLGQVNQISRTRQVLISGTLPDSPKCRKFIADSGFLDYMVDLAGKKFKRHSKNFLVNVGGQQTNNKIVGGLIKKSMNEFLGFEAHFPPAYSIIQEMCGNSVEHANKGSNSWLLGINCNYDHHNKVQDLTFTMTDFGFGILKTILKKHQSIIEKFKLRSNLDILIRAFDRKYGSSTEDVNRNKGLPLIKKRQLLQYIKGLKVVTNNVLLDFEDPSNSRVIESGLPGTFYIWKIDKSCIETWNNQKR